MVKKEEGGVLTGGDNFKKLKALRESMGGGGESRIDTSSVGAALAGFEFPEAVIKEYTSDYKDKNGLETVKKYQKLINAELEKIEKNRENIDLNQYVLDFFCTMKSKPPKKLMEAFEKNIGKPVVETAPEPVAKTEQKIQEEDFKIGLKKVRTEGELLAYLESLGHAVVKSKQKGSVFFPAYLGSVKEGLGNAEHELGWYLLDEKIAKIKMAGKEVKKRDEAREEYKKIDSVNLEKMLESVDSQEALITFCEDNKKISVVSSDRTHRYLPSIIRLEKIFSGKIDWREISIIPLRRKIIELMQAKENPTKTTRENSNENKLTQAEFKEKYADILGVNFSDEKGENWMFIYSDGYDEKTGKVKIFLQKGPEKGISNRYTLDELEEFLKIYIKRKAEGEKKTPEKVEKKLTPTNSLRKQENPKQKDLDAFEASLKTNGNRKVYSKDSTPDDAREAGMKAKNLKKMGEQKTGRVEREKVEETSPEIRAFIEASVEEGKKWKEFLESEKGRALFDGDEKFLREKVESFVSGGLKWYADFSEKDKEIAVEETMKKIFS